MTAFASVAPFGALPVPAGVEVVGIPAAVGTLTALHAPATGARDARGTVLFVPGFTGSKEDFRTFLPLLAAEGWDVWAYSQRGQADSAAPSGVESYRLDALAADTVEVARLIGDGQAVHLIGHSLGGVVAREATIAAPDAFASFTMLCSGPTGWPGRHQQTTDTVSESGSIGLWNRDNPHTVGQSDSALTPDEAFLRLRAERTSSDNLLAGAEILRADHDTTDALRASGVPVLVAHGEFDDAWPIPMQQHMAERLGASYAVIEGGHHSPQLEAPEATVSALTTFLSTIH
ncbi:alpha/beta hydrolase [Leifsonia lichenia]